MDNIIERGLLFDFYGELLTPHQQKIYGEIIYNDLSLSEMSEQEGISRQGIHDLVKRCDRQLQEYESRLGLVQRFQKIKVEADRMSKIIDSDSFASPELKEKLRASLKSIVEDL
ncbi:MAG: DNA-binding protein [Lachnospiraceae bacterium]|nr:DNA-binding protein [Lachnospiraceae bacterium]